MNHCLWSTPGQQQKIQDILTEAVAKHGYTMAVNLSSLKKEVKAFQEEVEQEIRIPHKVSVEQLMPMHDEYFELEKQDNQFSGVYIDIKQYRGLSIDEPQVVNFFDEQKNLVNKMRVLKGEEENTILVIRESKKTKYRLKTRLIEKTDYITKKTA
jgi:MoxR-like ATPase